MKASPETTRERHQPHSPLRQRDGARIPARSMPGSLDNAKNVQDATSYEDNTHSVVVIYNVVNPDASPKGTTVMTFTICYTEDVWGDFTQREYVHKKQELFKKVMDNFEHDTGIIIHDCIEEIEQAMKGMLAPKFREVVLGHAEIRQTFKVSGIGTIGGAYVQDGKIVRACEVRIVRDGIVIHEGHLNSLKRFKDDVKEVATHFECGLGFENYNDIKEGDIVESFIMEEVKP